MVNCKLNCQLYIRQLPCLLGFCRPRVMSRDDFTVTFPQLLLNFFGHQINGCIQVTFMILRKHIRPFEIQMHGAFILVFRETDMVPLQIHPGFQGPLVHVFKFVNTDAHMVFNCLGEFNIVGIKNKLHRVEECPEKAQMTSKTFAASRHKSCQLNESGIPKAKAGHRSFYFTFSAGLGADATSNTMGGENI